MSHPTIPLCVPSELRSMRTLIDCKVEVGDEVENRTLESVGIVGTCGLAAGFELRKVLATVSQ